MARSYNVKLLDAHTTLEEGKKYVDFEGAVAGTLQMTGGAAGRIAVAVMGCLAGAEVPGEIVVLDTARGYRPSSTRSTRPLPRP